MFGPPETSDLRDALEKERNTRRLLELRVASLEAAINGEPPHCTGYPYPVFLSGQPGLRVLVAALRSCCPLVERYDQAIPAGWKVEPAPKKKTSKAKEASCP